MSAERDWLDAALDSFRAKMKWSEDATDYQRTLVYGNLTGFVGHLRAVEEEVAALSVEDRSDVWGDACRESAVMERLRQGDGIKGQHVCDLLRQLVERDYPSLRACAARWKISPAYLSDVIRGQREPGPAILRRLGLVKVVAVSYRASTKAAE